MGEVGAELQLEMDIGIVVEVMLEVAEMATYPGSGVDPSSTNCAPCWSE